MFWKIDCKFKQNNAREGKHIKIRQTFTKIVQKQALFCHNKLMFAKRCVSLVCYFPQYDFHFHFICCSHNHFAFATSFLCGTCPPQINEYSKQNRIMASYGSAVVGYSTPYYGFTFLPRQILRLLLGRPVRRHICSALCTPAQHPNRATTLPAVTFHSASASAQPTSMASLGNKRRYSLFFLEFPHAYGVPES